MIAPGIGKPCHREATGRIAEWTCGLGLRALAGERVPGSAEQRYAEPHDDPHAGQDVVDAMGERRVGKRLRQLMGVCVVMGNAALVPVPPQQMVKPERYMRLS